MLALLRYSLRSLWVRRTTTLATAFGIALVAFVLAASSMLAAGIRRTMVSAGSEDQALVLEHDAWAEAASRMDRGAVAQVAAAPGVKRDATGQVLLTEESVAQLMLPRLTEENRFSTLQVRGVSANVFELRPEARVISGRPIQPGTEEALVGKEIVGRFPGLRIGERIDFSASTKPTVVGIFETGGTAYDSEIWADFETARRALNFQANVSSVTAQLESPASIDAFSAPLTLDKERGLSVSSEGGYYRKVSQGLPDVIRVLGIVETLIFSIGAVLGALITMHASVAQRGREIGVLRALGFGRMPILVAFLAESMALGLGGAAVGVSASLLTSFLDFRCVNFATGQEVAFRFVPTFDALGLAVATGVIVGGLGGLIPAVRASGMSPARALRA